MSDNQIKANGSKLLALEKTIEQGLRTFNDVGSALLQIRDGKLYHPQYSSFEEYCRTKWDMKHSRAYQLMDSAQVMSILKTSTNVEVLPANEAQVRPLALLPAEKVKEAWKEAKEQAPNGQLPTGSMVRRVVDRFLGQSKKKKQPEVPGWTTDEVKNDVTLMADFTAIATVYGNEDTKAIRMGGVGLLRADVAALAKLPKEKMLEIRDLIFENHWKPKDCLKFLGEMADRNSTVEDLMNFCLATKEKFFEAVFNGYTITCVLKRPNR